MKIKIIPAILAALQPIIWWVIGTMLIKYDKSADGIGIGMACVFSCVALMVLFIYLAINENKLNQ